MKSKFDFSVSPQEVFGLITDPDFLVERSLAIGELEAECEVEQYEGETTLNMKRRVERDLPGVLASLFDSSQTLLWEEKWTVDGDGYKGDYRISIDGVPVTIDASFSLNPTAAGCEYLLQHKAKVKIPLFANKVEKYVIKNISQDLQKEMDFLAGRLSS